MLHVPRVMHALPDSLWGRIERWRFTPFVLFAVLGMWTLIFVHRNGVWFDESYSILLVGKHDVSEIARRTAVDGHPPLWYWVLKPWVEIFGTHIVAVRLQQALFMFVGLAIWYNIIRTKLSCRVSLLTLLITVTNPMIVQYTVEGRMYAFGVLLTALSTLLISSEWRRSWIAYWPVSVIMLYTHYFLAFIIAGQFVWLFMTRRRRGVHLWKIVAYGASIVAAFIPWIPFALGQTTKIVAGGFWIGPVTPHTPLGYVEAAFLRIPDHDAHGWLVFPALFFIVVFIATLIRARAVKSENHTLLWCLLAVPWFALFVLSCKPFVPIFHSRYVLFSLPALIAIVSAGVLAMTKRYWKAVAIVTIIGGQLVGNCVAWRRGNTDSRNFYAMKSIAREIGKPIEGALPAVVATWQFGFFDAKATLSESQRVVILRESVPQFGSTDAIYYDKPDWYITDMSALTSRYVWVMADASKPPPAIPSHWSLVNQKRRGYARLYLYRQSRIEHAD